MKPADLSKPLEPIYRILYCGHCKRNWQMRGRLGVRGQTVTRVFTCPYCLKIAKRDYMTRPTYRAIETRKHNEPQFYNSEAVKFNKMLLEQEEE